MTTTEPFPAGVVPVVKTRQISIVCAALDVHRDDWLLFWRWSDDLSNPKTLDELHAYVDVMIADRCRRPGDDILSKLIELEVDGEELNTEDIHSLVVALVAGAGSA